MTRYWTRWTTAALMGVLLIHVGLISEVLRLRAANQTLSEECDALRAAVRHHQLATETQRVLAEMRQIEAELQAQTRPHASR